MYVIDIKKISEEFPFLISRCQPKIVKGQELSKSGWAQRIAVSERFVQQPKQCATRKQKSDRGFSSKKWTFVSIVYKEFWLVMVSQSQI